MVSIKRYDKTRGVKAMDEIAKKHRALNIHTNLWHCLAIFLFIFPPPKTETYVYIIFHYFHKVKYYFK